MIIGAFLVKSMPLGMLRWLVIVVVLYAAFVMLKAAISGRRIELLTAEEATALG